jgi:hypothetical protein
MKISHDFKAKLESGGIVVARASVPVIPAKAGIQLGPRPSSG